MLKLILFLKLNIMRQVLSLVTSSFASEIITEE